LAWFDVQHRYFGSTKALRCVVLEAALYQDEIVRCTTSQQFYNILKSSFLDVQKMITTNSVSPGFIAMTFLPARIDFLRADFNPFSNHIEGVILTLKSYTTNLDGKPFHPTVSFISMICCMSDGCIGFFGDKERFPDDLFPRDFGWVDTFIHRDEIPRALVVFGRVEWVRIIARFRRWAETQRRATGRERKPFVEEAIARQGDAITEQILAWGDRSIPKYEELRAPGPSRPALILRRDGGYNDYIENPIASIDSHQFLQFPLVQFQNKEHNEMVMLYLGLLLLVSYSAYPESGSLPVSRWELAVQFCQCFAAYPDKEGMDSVNQILHLFYARLTFDDSFPQGMSGHSYIF
jgi:hypothetical protein